MCSRPVMLRHWYRSETTQLAERSTAVTAEEQQTESHPDPYIESSKIFYENKKKTQN